MICDVGILDRILHPNGREPVVTWDAFLRSKVPNPDTRKRYEAVVKSFNGGCRRLTRSRVNVLAGRFILDAGCVVSAPLPALSGPSACAGPPYLGRGDVPQQPRGVTVGRPRSPGRPRHPCGPIWT